MIRIAHADMLKEIRSTAKSNGLIFKRMNQKLNNVHMWKFCDSESGETVVDNCTMHSAYELCRDGHISSYDKETKQLTR